MNFCNWRRSLYPLPEDFVYPRDKHSREYGWGWSLLTTPERLYGKDACSVDCSPKESYQLMTEHLQTILPHASAA